MRSLDIVVFSNRRLLPGSELLVSREVAAALVREVAAVAGPEAEARWERELVAWLKRWATLRQNGFDVSDIAWPPEHFERQRGFLAGAIRRVAAASRHARTLVR